MDKNLVNSTFILKTSAANSGAVTIKYNKTVTLKKNGIPLKAGDIKDGDEITFNRLTGEIE